MAKKTVKPAQESSAGSRSGSDLIREQLNKGVTKPSAIIAAIKSEYGVDVKNALVNGVKMAWKKKSGVTTRKIAKRGRKAAASIPLAATPAASSRAQSAGNMSQNDAAILLVEQFGAAKAREIISVLGK